VLKSIFYPTCFISNSIYFQFVFTFFWASLLYLRFKLIIENFKNEYSPNDRFLIKVFIKIISLDSSQRVPPMSPCPPLILTRVCPWLINHLSDPWDLNKSNRILIRSNWRKPYPNVYGSELLIIKGGVKKLIRCWHYWKWPLKQWVFPSKMVIFHSFLYVYHFGYLHSMPRVDLVEPLARPEWRSRTRTLRMVRIQWSCQEPINGEYMVIWLMINGNSRNRLIGGTDSIYKAYFLGLCLREYPQKI